MNKINFNKTVCVKMITDVLKELEFPNYSIARNEAEDEFKRFSYDVVKKVFSFVEFYKRVDAQIFEAKEGVMVEYRRSGSNEKKAPLEEFSFQITLKDFDTFFVAAIQSPKTDKVSSGIFEEVCGTIINCMYAFFEHYKINAIVGLDNGSKHSLDSLEFKNHFLNDFDFKKLINKKRFLPELNIPALLYLNDDSASILNLSEAREIIKNFYNSDENFTSVSFKQNALKVSFVSNNDTGIQILSSFVLDIKEGKLNEFKICLNEFNEKEIHTNMDEYLEDAKTLLLQLIQENDLRIMRLLVNQSFDFHYKEMATEIKSMVKNEIPDDFLREVFAILGSQKEKFFLSNEINFKECFKFKSINKTPNFTFSLLDESVYLCLEDNGEKKVLNKANFIKLWHEKLK